jgi:hypothetical protein
MDSKEQLPIPPLADIEEDLRAEIAQPEIDVKTKELFADLYKEYQVKHLFSSEELFSFEPFHMAEKLT